MMEVVNTSPFDVIFTFVRHPYFGMLIEANAVQLLSNGEYSLTFQRIRKNNCNYFSLNAEQTEAVKLIEEFEVENIIKLFYKGNKRIRPAEFFLKHYSAELQKNIRDYIERRIPRILALVRNYPLFYAGKNEGTSAQRLKYSEQPASVLFHFRRDGTGTNYFATIRQETEKIEIYHNGSEILSANPAWLLTPTGLFHFAKHIDGTKIKPFLLKKHIHVDPRNEDVYMEKFVKPLLENHDVYAVGFDIVTEQFKANPVLKITRGMDAMNYVSLYFQYGNWIFPYHVNKRVNVSVDKRGSGFLFHRIRRSFNWEAEKIAFLKELGLENADGSLFALQAGYQNYEIISWMNENSEQLQRAGFDLQQELPELKYFLGSINIVVSVNKNSDWFDVKAMVQFGKFEISFVRLRKHILERKREFILPDGSVAVLPEEWFSRFGKIAHLAEVESDAFRLKNMHFALLGDLQGLLAEEEGQTLDWENKLLEGNIPEYELSPLVTANLRSYQTEGYHWMRYLHDHKIGALLADDMGLGKTVQTLAILAHYQNTNKKYSVPVKQARRVAAKTPEPNKVPQLALFGIDDVAVASKSEKQNYANKELVNGPCIVITPKSLLYNWQSEATKFTPGLKTLVYSGIARNRLLPQFEQQDIVVMSYGTMRNDVEILSRFHFKCIVLDESQAIKNPGSQTAKSLMQLHSTYRLALTGTPIENTLLDIWSQMNFLNPGLLGNYHYFEKQFIRPIEKSGDQKRTAELRKILDPFILRRTKKQVARELPEKIEKIHYCEMTEEQSVLYEKVKSQYRNEILEHVQQMGMARSRLKIFNGLMHLRQLALNPLLKDDEFVGNSGKDEEIRHMLFRAIEGGHKVLLFSQFVSYLKIYVEMLESEGISFCYLDGSMNAKQRATEIEKFQNDENIKVFLLSLRAGNSGINLTAADYVFLADPWWNPFTMKQAEDRAHRIGQERAVFSYKFITKNTIEEKILTLQQKKTELAGSIIPDEDTVLAALDVLELTELLS